MTRRRRLLVISYHFPPRPGVASVRLRNLVRHLPEHGWDIDVLAGPAGTDPDMTLTDGLELNRVVRVEPLRRAPRLQGADWAAASLPAARRLAHEADVVMVSGGPFAPFLLGRRLRRPYVLDFRDPWTWEPRFQRLTPRLRRRLALRLERFAEGAAVGRAAAALTVAPELTQAYATLYPRRAERFATVRHGWEPADFSPAVEAPAAEPELVHAGSFLAGERTPELIVETARLVRRTGTPLRVRLVGALPPAMRELTGPGEAEGWLEVAGLRSHREAIAAMRRAAVLWIEPGALPFLITGKVYEYLAAGAPIVAVAPVAGALAALLAETGGAFVVESGPSGCAEAVLAALAGEVLARRDDAISRLATPELAKALAAILDRVRT